MATDTQRFFQRVLDTFGSPLKFGGENKSPDLAEDMSAMPIKSSQTTSVDGKHKKPPGLVHNCMHTSTRSIFGEQMVTELSKTSDRETIGQNLDNINSASWNTQASWNTKASWNTQQNDEELKPQFSEEPARVITVKDGSKDYLAILLTERMIHELLRATETAGILQRAESEYEDVKLDVKISQSILKKNKTLIETTESSEEREKLDEQIRTQEPILAKETERKKELKTTVVIQRLNLEYSNNMFQSTFRRAFQEANLLDQAETSGNTGVENQQSAVTPQESVISNQSNGTLPDPDKLFQRMAAEDIEEKTKRLRNIEGVFEAKEVEYYQQSFYEDKIECSRTVFDVLALDTLRNITGELVEAEADLESALAHGKALGIIVNDYDQESGFVDDVNDGYAASEVAAFTADLDRTFINAWNEDVSNSEDLKSQGSEEPDEWEAESVGISDSISCVDYSRNRRRIDRWRKICEK